MQNLSLDNGFGTIECRIRTLTTLLQNIHPRNTPDEPVSSPPGLLDHLVNLFQGDDEKDGYPADRISMAGVETADGLRILAVTENMSGAGDTVKVIRITKSDRTFDELVNGQIGSSVKDCISDIWAALALFEEDTNDLRQRFQALTQCIVARNFWKISSLLREINSPSNLELSRVLLDWEPQPYDLQEPRWICVPSWLTSIDHHKWHNRDLIEQRKVAGPTGVEVQWEISLSSAKGWIGLLARFMDELVSAFQIHEDILRSDSKDTSALENIVTWTFLLSSYLHWEEGILQTLLKKTSLSFKLKTHAFDKACSAHSKSTFTSGAHVLSHLKKIVAWYDALQNLCFNEEYSSIRKPSQTHATCLVEIPASPEASRLCGTREDLTSHFIKQCTPSVEKLSLFEALLDEHYTTEFYGSVHAEAVLMGLIAHFSQDFNNSTSNSYGVEFKQETRAILEEFILPLPAEKVIVLSDGFPPCSCCRWLSTRLNSGFQLTSTKGQKFVSTSAWTPPPVGVDTALLEDLEANLLDELDFRLRIMKISTSHEDQPDTISDNGYAATISDYSSPEEDRDFEVSD
ncbi:hypothetical protein CVT25_002360 [Psilocybe cyanescens]|uniref:Uncharacterized protein n=1 Tax=Psilocybe cyanescens TaxID=93625 RepID=A0A409WKQ6_PSICY|nr:hypothetical protein CVT25_002360 [Psilocybe cyanescens]